MNIQPKLVLSFLCIISISIILTSFLLFQYVEQAVIDSELLSMTHELEQKINDINTLHTLASNDLVFTLKNSLFREYFELPETKTGNVYKEGVLQFTERQKEIKLKLEELLYHFQKKFQVDETCIIDVTGQEHASLVLSEIKMDGDLSSDEMQTPFFTSSFEKNKDEVHIQYPYVSPDTNRWVIAYASPVVLDSNETPAIYHFEMPLTVFAEIINPSVGQMFVVDASGKIILDPKHYMGLELDKQSISSNNKYASEFEEHESLSHTLTSTSPELQNVIYAIISDNNENILYINNEIYYAMYESLPTFDWKLVYMVPYSSLLLGHDILDSIKLTMMTISAILLGGGIIAAVFVSNKITKPLLLLKQTTEKISRYDYDIQISSHDDDEIGQLGTSFQKMVDKIKYTEKAKSEFISMITHELKTPLQPIQGYTHMLKTEELGSLNEKQINAVKEIDCNSADLLHLIENLLTAQKLEMKELEFHNITIPLKEFAESIHRSLLPLMSEKNINFVNLINIDSSITADSARLKEVFTNLVQNSIDFVEPQTGKISFGIFDETENKIILYVKDNGKGIPEEYQKNIFKKFWQVDSSLSRKHGGTGLGLSICHNYIKQMGGNLWLKSKSGVETIFYFDLPKSS